jgi:hypothetical protein
MASPTNTKDLKPIRPGPRKKDLKPGALKPRPSGYKKRSAWFQARSSWPFREAPVDILALERNRAEGRYADSRVHVFWECIRPTALSNFAESRRIFTQIIGAIWARLSWRRACGKR